MKKALFVTAILTLAPFVMNAVLAGPPNPPGVPIDGGVSILLALGAGYGVKKIRDHKKKNK